MAQVLQPIRDLFNASEMPELLVGLDVADDAAVYQLNEDQAIISTTDFFPPVVDDPYDFGAIAAANALSDVYAMGGEVLFAINLVAFPDHLDRAILSEILRGGAEKVKEAGAAVVGGHSVTDKEPKYGLAVTGIISPDAVKRKGGAQVGDILVLTKPLGVGVITTALKREEADAADVAAAVESMKTLNRDAARAAREQNASAMTDITGFGLLGHSWEMAKAGQVRFEFEAAGLPFLSGAAKYGKGGAFPGGMLRNQEFFAEFVEFGSDVSKLMQNLLWTPETSGGLLIAVSADQADELLSQVAGSQAVGRVVSGQPGISVV